MKAGHGTASAGLWLRDRRAPSRLVVATVAHVFFDRHGRRRTDGRLAKTKVDVEWLTALTEARQHASDIALMSGGWQQPLETTIGHLHTFRAGLPVQQRMPNGSLRTGTLYRERWSGMLRYRFGNRRLIDQWLVRLDPKQRLPQPGESGELWLTDDGVAVGIQVGFLPRRPFRAILTPVARICDDHGLRVAG